MKSSSVRDQYERFPYPPIPLLALPRPGQGQKIKYESIRPEGSHKGIRILIAGCGTLEPLIVAEAHPQAREIVAVDLSEHSVRRARLRLRLARIAPSRLWTRFGPLRFVQSDLFNFSEDEFDYVLASNVLHHTVDPAGLLKHLSGLLKTGGILRLVTYPKSSRTWMRAVSKYLRAAGMTPETPNLKARVHELIRELPASSPIRLTFESQPETRTTTGIVDAFLHSLENPLYPLEWAKACADAGLELVAEGQSETSRSTFMDEIFPEASSLDAWVKLQILDDLLELCANPILWLEKTGNHWNPTPLATTNPNDNEWKQNLTRVAALLGPTGLSLQEVFERLRTEVGPRVSTRDPNQALAGLALSDYDLNELLR